MMMRNKIRPLLLWLTLSSPVLADDDKSALFVPSDDLCPPSLAECAAAPPCFDHSIGICDAETGEMDVAGVPDCVQGLQFCTGCFPHSKCGVSASDESAADDSAAEEPLDVSPDALAHLDAVHTCLGDGDDARCFYTYVPECAGADAPLVLDMHGFGSTPQYSSFYSGWAAKAAENCFVVAFPLGNTDPAGTSTCWEFPGGAEDADGNVADACCCSALGISSAVDDAFLRDAVAHVVESMPGQTDGRVAIDAKRIYMAGHSNGCMAAIAMAALHSDLVAAVGCHAGTALTPFPESYTPTPMMMVHGTADKDVDFEGGVVDGFTVLGAREVHALVAAANGCATMDEVRTVGENNYTTYEASGCEGGAGVVLLALDDVGHNPYLGFEELVGIVDGAPTRVDTTQLVWDFVSKHSLAVAPDLGSSGEVDDEEIGDGTASKADDSDLGSSGKIDDGDTDSTVAEKIVTQSPTATPDDGEESADPPSSASLSGYLAYNTMLFPLIWVPLFLFYQ